MTTYARITFHSGGPMTATPRSLAVRKDEYGEMRLHWRSRNGGSACSVALDDDIIAITFVFDDGGAS